MHKLLLDGADHSVFFSVPPRKTFELTMFTPTVTVFTTFKYACAVHHTTLKQFPFVLMGVHKLKRVRNLSVDRGLHITDSDTSGFKLLKCDTAFQCRQQGHMDHIKSVSIMLSTELPK